MDDAVANRVAGSLLGLALGDAFGAPHEGGILERALWGLLGKRNGKRRWTDDTQMSIDMAESLVACGGVDQEDLARRFAASYRWSRGYGPGAAKVLKRIRRGQPWEVASRSVYPEGSFGNGGAMRAPLVGLFFASGSEDEIAEAARRTAEVTHAHPLGRDGAVLIALAASLAYAGRMPQEAMARLCGYPLATQYRSRLQVAAEWLDDATPRPARAVARELGNGIAAVESCVTAVYVGLAFRSRPFMELLDYAIELRGDVDTIAAMAGAIWGASCGIAGLPEGLLRQLEQRERLARLAHALACSMA
jgi:poly(ADP-ribose) glycohydrolase ARH3